MSEKNKDRCFQGSQGHLYMEAFDELDPYSRELLRQSPYNICAACFYDEIHVFDRKPIEVLRYFEEEIRTEIRCVEAA